MDIILGSFRIYESIFVFQTLSSQMSIHAKISSEAEKKLQVQHKRSRILSGVIACLSLILIAGILSLFALPMMLIETPTIVTYSATLEEEPDLQEKKVVQKPERNPSAPAQNMAKVIAANTTAPTSIPVPDVAVAEPSLHFGDDVDFGQGWGDDEMGTTGGLFGRQITSKNLGVVLDISGSAHRHLDKAINEIDNNFPKAHIILVVGCGMSDGKGALGGGGGKVPGKPRIVPYKNIDSEKEYNSLTRSAPGQLELFLNRLDEKRSKELRRYFKERDNLYALYGADIHGANFAFDFLLDINVDTIYWFADFADRINEKIIEDVTQKLLRNRVTVISHNFLGRPVGKLATEMTEKTGGQTIETIPGQE